MSAAHAIWRRRLGIWLTPAVALFAATFYLAFIQRGVRSQSATLDARLETAQREHEKALTSLEQLETLDASAQAARAQMALFMEEKFATEGGRFTSLVREIKQLAEHAGLDPREIGYPEEEYSELGLVRRSFVFNVQGSYANLRAFVYLLELSPSYVTVDRMEVRELGGTKGLAVSLSLSTFFVAPPNEAAAPAARSRS